MGHGRGALLGSPERLLHFAKLGLLQRADLRREGFETSGEDAERGHDLRVAITRDDLRGDRRGREPKVPAHFGLDVGPKVRERAHGARELPHGHFCAGGDESPPVPGKLVVPECQLEAEGHGLGVNPVGAADHHRVLVLEGAGLHRLAESIEIGEKKVESIANHERESGVDDIGRSEAVVEEPAFRPHVLGDRTHEGDDVMTDVLLDGVDAGHVETRLLEQDVARRLRHHASPGQGVGGREFDLQPGREAILVRPDAGHLRPGVTGDHGQGKHTGRESRRRNVGIKGGVRPRAKLDAC